MEIDYRNFAHTILVLGLFYAVLIYLDTNPGRAPNMNWITTLVVRLIFAKILFNLQYKLQSFMCRGFEFGDLGGF